MSKLRVTVNESDGSETEFDAEIGKELLYRVLASLGLPPDWSSVVIVARRDAEMTSAALMDAAQ